MPDGHHVAISKFLIACSNVEGVVRQAIRSTSNIDENLARFLTTTNSVEALVNTLADLCEYLGHDEGMKVAMKALKRELLYLFKIRNVFAHQVPAWRDGWLRFDNYASAKSIKNRPSLIYVIQMSELANIAQFAASIVRPLLMLTTYWSQSKRVDLQAVERILDELNALELPSSAG